MGNAKPEGDVEGKSKSKPRADKFVWKPGDITVTRPGDTAQTSRQPARKPQERPGAARQRQARSLPADRQDR